MTVACRTSTLLQSCCFAMRMGCPWVHALVRYLLPLMIQLRVQFGVQSAALPQARPAAWLIPCSRVSLVAIPTYHQQLARGRTVLRRIRLVIPIYHHRRVSLWDRIGRRRNRVLGCARVRHLRPEHLPVNEPHIVPLPQCRVPSIHRTIRWTGS